MKPDLFTYITPTPVTAPRYSAVREAHAACAHELWLVAEPIVDTQARFMGAQSSPTPGDFEAISDACRAYLGVCVAQAPRSADLSAAERCIRLARMLANEAIGQRGGDASEPWRLMVLAKDELLKARLQTCAAIALADEAELPVVEG
jgi:hypothetical protein